MRFRFWDRIGAAHQQHRHRVSSAADNTKTKEAIHLPSSDATAATATPDACDCFICLESMAPTDLAHPLSCRNCRFNLCCKCLEIIYQQSPVHCPNCRSNISATICDTILLRKVDQDHNDDDRHHRSNDDDDDFEWRKVAMSEPTILKEIANARYREAKFVAFKQQQQHEQQYNIDHHQHHHDDGEVLRRQQHQHPEEEVDQRDPGDDAEEHGFEVDVRVGPHASIKLPTCTEDEDDDYFFFANHAKTDVTLLAGVDGVMSVVEQQDVTRRLTSGDPNELATAAATLAAITTRVVEHKRTSIFDQHKENEEEDPTGNGTTGSIVVNSKALSVYELIQDGKRARRKEQQEQLQQQQQRHHLGTTTTTTVKIPKKNNNNNNHKPPQKYVKYYNQKRAQNRATERQVRRQCALLRQFPLPTRMPKVISMVDTVGGGATATTTTHHMTPLQFVDSVWDGTVQDAYCVNSSNNSHHSTTTLLLQPTVPFQCIAVTNYSMESPHFHYHYHNMRIDTPRPRIVLASAGKQGERPGDVVTHLNGVPIPRHMTAALLTQLLQQQEQEQSKHSSPSSPSPPPTTKITSITLNADLPVAHALKRRAAAMREYHRRSYMVKLS